MANVIKHKRGSGSDPSASDLILGELAIRTDTGKLFTKMDSGAIAEIAGGGSDIAINTLSSSSATGGGSATFNGSAYRFTLSAPPNVSAAQLLVSINGVIQKPVAGTGQPSEGFSVDGTDIILGDAPATGSDFFILTFKSLGVSEPADNSVTSAKIVDGAIVNADINASAAIAGTKVSPDFGSQNIETTGGLVITRTGQVPEIELNGNGPNFIRFTDSVVASHSLDLIFRDSPNTLGIEKSSDGTVLFSVDNDDGQVIVTNNLDVGAGLDVTGAITGTGDMTIDTNTLHVDSSLNRVGIGTTSPDSKLHVSGDSATAQLLLTRSNAASNTNDYGRILWESQDDVLTGKIAVARESAENNGYMHFSTASGGTLSERMRIDSSGNLILGGTTASGALTVVSTKNAESGRSNSQNYHLHLRNNENDNGEAIGISFGITSSSTGVGASILHERDSSGSQGSLQFYTNGDGSNVAERMRIDSSGKVGIGTSSPASLLNLDVDTESNLGSGSEGIRLTSGSSNAQFVRLGSSYSNNSVTGPGTLVYSSNKLSLRCDNGNPITFHTGSTVLERMRIADNGDVRFGTTSAVGAGVAGAEFHQANNAELRCGVSGTGNSTQIRFYNANGEVGAIRTNGSATVYHTSSDYRRKENAVRISDGITRLKTLKPYKFNFKADPSTILDGFFAHEVSPVVPEAISGTKDEVDENNEPVYQGIDQSKLVPLLTAALQEAIGRIEALEAK